jgi:large subunit ribosomal protein L19
MDLTSSPRVPEEQTPKIPDLRSGDTVKVFYKIKEEGKERVQPFEGVILARKGAGNSKTITVRKIASLGIGVERIFPLFSPNIGKIEVIKRGKVRRSKLYSSRIIRSK